MVPAHTQAAARDVCYHSSMFPLPLVSCSADPTASRVANFSGLELFPDIG